MTNWREYKITRKVECSKYVRFHLDSWVRYKDGSREFIDCTDTSYFANWREDDKIEINSDEARKHSNEKTFTFYDNVAFKSDSCYENWYHEARRECDEWKTKFYGKNNEWENCKRKIQELEDKLNKLGSLKSNSDTQLSSLQRELDKQKGINSQLVSTFNSFSQKILGEKFISSSHFTEYDLSSCKQKLDRIINKIETEKEEKTALITRSSTDLSTTKETLRLTQVANIALQKEVGEKTELIRIGAGTLQTTQQQLTTSQNQVREKTTQINQRDTRINQLGNELTTTRTTKDNQIGQLNTQVATKNLQITQVTNERNDYERKWVLNETEVKKITDSFNKLTLEKKEKENELKQKEREVIELKEQLGLSQEEILTNKIASREKELDNTVYSLKFNHETVMNLCDAYEKLDLTHRDYNRDNITNAKNNIKAIKEELFTFATENETSVDDLYKIYQGCEEIAKWRVELEQLKENQYQARQEVLTNH